MSETGHDIRLNPLPLRKPEMNGGYDIYPSFRLQEGLIATGYGPLADKLLKHRILVIDGYNGVCWDRLRDEICAVATEKGKTVQWIHTGQFLKSEEAIRELTSGSSGGRDPLFGKRCESELAEFYDLPELKRAVPDVGYDICAIAGPGATLAGWQGLIVYADIPKNELQYRSRTGSITNLGMMHPSSPKEMYKRSYFIDWQVLNRHKAAIIESVELFIDAQRADDPVWIEGDELRKALHRMSRNLFRVRPWFEPGPWGGSWIRDNIRGLNKNVPNYAWSFELITPENGLLLESSSLLLEVSFDCLMYTAAESVLGDCHRRFGNDFPIRFDFLDTIDGGNLSVQCHPGPEYAREHFGENFTQEESYYILDTKDNAVVYLGFTDNIDPVKFRDRLEESFEKQIPFETDSFIMRHPSAKHDLFLIPYGTVHGSGRNNLVLEISTTPYIFTFKMYDWLRLDLSGQPRDLNIERAMENLRFERKGSYVTDSLKAKPVLLEEGNGWQKWHLPTHETHLYDVHRYIIRSSVEILTENKCLVMNLAEGEKVLVETRDGLSLLVCFAETFVIAAAAEGIRITNLSGSEAVVVKAFIK